MSRTDMTNIELTAQSNCLCQLKIEGVKGRILTSCWYNIILPSKQLSGRVNTDLKQHKAGCCSASHRPGYSWAPRSHSVVCKEVTDPTRCWKKATQCVFRKLWDLLITQHVGWWDVCSPLVFRVWKQISIKRRKSRGPGEQQREERPLVGNLHWDTNKAGGCTPGACSAHYLTKLPLRKKNILIKALLQQRPTRCCTQTHEVVWALCAAVWSSDRLQLCWQRWPANKAQINETEGWTEAVIGLADARSSLTLHHAVHSGQAVQSLLIKQTFVSLVETFLLC